MSFFIAIIIGAALGVAVPFVYLSIKFFNARQRESQLRKERTKTIKIEKIGQTFYVYDADAPVFYVQGKTLDELKTKMITQFPQFWFVIDQNLNDSIQQELGIV